MNAQTLALRAYSNASAPIKNARSIEYEIIAKVSHQLRKAATERKQNYAGLVQALSDNQRLWTALAADVADKENQLPAELKAQIFYLAEFVGHQTRLVLTKKGRVTPLLEVNTAILRGLSGRKK